MNTLNATDLYTPPDGARIRYSPSLAPCTSRASRHTQKGRILPLGPVPGEAGGGRPLSIPDPEQSRNPPRHRRLGLREVQAWRGEVGASPLAWWSTLASVTPN